MRIIKIKAVLVTVFVATLAVSVSAQDEGVFSHADGGIQFTAPIGWEAEPDGDSIVLSSPDGAVGVMLYVLNAETLELAAEALDVEIGKMVSDPVVSDKSETMKINGLDVFATTGKGKIEGQAVDFIVLIVMGKKPVMIFAVAESASFEKNKPQINALMQSIAPIK